MQKVICECNSCEEEERKWYGRYAERNGVRKGLSKPYMSFLL